MERSWQRMSTSIGLGEGGFLESIVGLDGTDFSDSPPNNWIMFTVSTKTQRTQTFWEPPGKTILKETRKV